MASSESFGISMQISAREVNDWGNIEVLFVSTCRELVRTPNGGYIRPIDDDFNYFSIPALFIRVPPDVVSSPERHQAYLNSTLASRLHFGDAPLRASVAENIWSFLFPHQAVSQLTGYFLTVELNFFHEIIRDERSSNSIWEADVNHGDSNGGGASRSSIMRLMEKGSFVASKSDQELGMCSICLEEFRSSNGSKELLRLDCSHVYHLACILPWLHKSNTCPACRRQVD